MAKQLELEFLMNPLREIMIFWRNGKRIKLPPPGDYKIAIIKFDFNHNYKRRVHVEMLDG